MSRISREAGVRTDENFLELIRIHGAIDLSLLTPLSGIHDNQISASTVSTSSDLSLYDPNDSPSVNLTRYIKHKYFRAVNPETDVSFVYGINLAIFLAIASTVKEGDGVIIFEPYATNLKSAVEICGARPVYIPLREPDFRIDWCEVQRAINASTKLLIISSPHALTGQVLDSEDLEELQRLINGTKIRIIFDESLAELVHSENEGSSINFYPKLCQVTYRIGSLTEIAGPNTVEQAYCIAPEPLMSAYRITQGAISICPDSAGLNRLLLLLNQRDALTNFTSYLGDNFRFLVNELGNSVFHISPSRAGYMVLLGYKGYSELKDVEFAQKLIVEKGVALQPLSRFYHDRQCRKLLAMNISCSRSKLEEAVARLKSL